MKKIIKQYPGVFSSDHIDYATQYLLEDFTLKEDENTILDLASGNGVIAKSLQEQNQEAEIHLLDDSFLAIRSSRLNISLFLRFF